MTKNIAHIPLEFFLTSPAPCPYLPGRVERRIFAELSGYNSAVLNHSLNLSGFRRSQTISYRPVCDNCSACISLRVDVDAFAPTRSMKRVQKRNSDLRRREVAAKTNDDHFHLFRDYVRSRHGDGGMEDMNFADYSVMVGAAAFRTSIFEYRIAGGDREGDLIAVCLTDEMYDGLSMVYSFFAPEEGARSLGIHMILDHLKEARARNLPYLYLGYWIEESPKMAYKARFRPCEGFIGDEWVPLDPAFSRARAISGADPNPLPRQPA